HSTSLHAVVRDRGAYMVGPLARYNLSFDQLADVAREAAIEFGPGRECHNPFRSIQVRAVELLHACDLAIRLIDSYEVPERSYVETTPRPGVGFGCSEAPRGICWHRYRIGYDGIIQSAKIVPPTSQNQKSIESDLREFVSQHLDLDTESLTWKCEQAIRNYDPCISCSCHFLKLEVTRE
ncbi:MAG: Ni/Fe hydrogenase subunit alpha, partial [Rhodothermales bacterium]|nr:Ni/Fe hydrogenase subunit alpha [Rhodothermales bacterium]